MHVFNTFSTGIVQPEGTFPTGAGMIWASENWVCKGYEDNVDDCQNFPSVNSQGDYSQEVGIYCYDDRATGASTTTTTKPTTTSNGSGSQYISTNKPTTT